MNLTRSFLFVCLLSVAPFFTGAGALSPKDKAASLYPADVKRFPVIWQEGGFNLEAHRGLSDLYPENTELSFAKAAELGTKAYRGMETDVQRTSDGVLVCFHDSKLRRTTGEEGSVGDYTYEKLRTFDAGRGERIPLFKTYLEYCRKAGFIPYVELKGVDGDGIRQTIDEIHAAGYKDGEFVLTSFVKQRLEFASTLCDTPLEYMKETFTSEDLDAMGGIRNLVVRPAARHLTEAFVQECRRRGIPLECYGLPVSDKTLYNQLKTWGVRGCTCNSYVVTLSS